MKDKRIHQVTALLIATAVGAITALCNWRHLILPPALQPTITFGITLAAGWVAPSIVDFSTRWGNIISVVLATASGAVAFAVANVTGMPQLVQVFLTGAIGFFTSLLLPSTAHPSRLADPPIAA